MLSDKQSDSFIIEIPNFTKRLTKRNILQTLASIYDALGFISPYLLTGKVIYQFICELKSHGIKRFQGKMKING